MRRMGNETHVSTLFFNFRYNTTHLQTPLQHYKFPKLNPNFFFDKKNINSSNSE